MSKSKKLKGRKRKLTPEQKRQKKLNREQYETIFINGKQKRVRRPPSIDGMPVDEFIACNADPVWLHQNGYHELLVEQEDEQGQDAPTQTTENSSREDSEQPF